MLAGILVAGKEKEITQQGKAFVSILAINNNPDREQHRLVNLLYMRNANTVCTSTYYHFKQKKTRFCSFVCTNVARFEARD